MSLFKSLQQKRKGLSTSWLAVTDIEVYLKPPVELLLKNLPQVLLALLGAEHRDDLLGRLRPVHHHHRQLSRPGHRARQHFLHVSVWRAAEDEGVDDLQGGGQQRLQNRPQLFKLNCATMVHIDLVEFFA